MRQVVLLLLSGVVVVLAIAWAVHHGSSESDEGGYERANVEMVWGAVPSPDYNVTRIYTDEGWVQSKHDGGIVLTSKGPVLELVGDEEVVLAHIGYGNQRTPTYGQFPWDGKGVVPPFKELLAKNGKWYKIPLNNIEALVTTYKHPYQQYVPGMCVGVKLGFKCGMG